MGRKILTKKQVIGIWTEATYLENLNHIEELTVDIPNHSDGSSDMDDIALLHQQLLRFCTYRLDNRFRKQFLPIEPLYALIEIDGSYCRHRRQQKRRTEGAMAHAYPEDLAWCAVQARSGEQARGAREKLPVYIVRALPQEVCPVCVRIVVGALIIVWRARTTPLGAAKSRTGTFCV